MNIVRILKVIIVVSGMSLMAKGYERPISLVISNDSLCDILYQIRYDNNLILYQGCIKSGDDVACDLNPELVYRVAIKSEDINPDYVVSIGTLDDSNPAMVIEETGEINFVGLILYS